MERLINEAGATGRSSPRANTIFKAARRKKFVIGLTGSFGSGKSTAAEMLRSLGAEKLDADEYAHQCMAPGERAYKDIVALFGRGILKDDASIDRGRLAGAVFRERRGLNRLNSIVHPCVIRRMKGATRQARARIVVWDVPLLLEAGMEKFADCVVVVRALRRQQIERVRMSKGLRRGEIIKRIQCQMPQSEKMRRADFIIDNSGSRQATRRQILRLWETIQASSGASASCART